MKKTTIYFLALLVVSAFTFSSCKDDDDNDQPFNAQAALSDYLVAQGLDLDAIIGGFVFDVPEDGDLSSRYLIDIRTADDFAAGHIEGAINVTWDNLLDEAANADKPILIICYSGNNATYLLGLLRLAGYADAQALKWGMSIWHTDFANHTNGWNNHIDNIAVGHANWTNAAAPANSTFENPTFTSTSTDPAEILKARINQVIADGFKRVTPAQALENPGAYFVNNFFSQEDYLNFGHIDGAFRIRPMLVGEGQMSFNDPSKEIVTYCYTGQTSGAITAFMRVLGYDAHSMVFGMNKLYHSNEAWTANRWTPEMSKDFQYVTK